MMTTPESLLQLWRSRVKVQCCGQGRTVKRERLIEIGSKEDAFE